jgi:hypothetical protein
MPDEVVRGRREGAVAAFVNLSKPQLNLPETTHRVLVLHTPPQEGEAVDSPHALAEDPMDPAEGPDHVRRIGSGPNPAQMGNRGEDHHRADGHVEPPRQAKEGLGKLSKLSVLNEDERVAISTPPPPPPAAQGVNTDPKGQSTLADAPPNQHHPQATAQGGGVHRNCNA